MVTAGWEITSTTPTTTFSQKFDRQVVDFENFLEAAPESDYNGARQMAVSCVSIAAAVMTFLFWGGR